MASDDDEEDLWGDFDNDEPEGNLMLSANLAEAIGVQPKQVVHRGDADEGMVTWVAPSFAGLQNSSSVDTVDWNKEKAPASSSVGGSQAPPTAATPAAAPGAFPAFPAFPAFGGAPGAQPQPLYKLPTGADGRIDWSALTAK